MLGCTMVLLQQSSGTASEVLISSVGVYHETAVRFLLKTAAFGFGFKTVTALLYSMRSSSQIY